MLEAGVYILRNRSVDSETTQVGAVRPVTCRYLLHTQMRTHTHKHVQLRISSTYLPTSAVFFHINLVIFDSSYQFD